MTIIFADGFEHVEPEDMDRFWLEHQRQRDITIWAATFDAVMSVRAGIIGHSTVRETCHPAWGSTNSVIYWSPERTYVTYLFKIDSCMN